MASCSPAGHRRCRSRAAPPSAPPGTSELVERVGAALGAETLAKGAHVLLGPTVNLHRSPLGGRHFECLSEDPILTALLAAAYVTGLQSTGVGACVKHLVANDVEADRFEISSEPDERTLREVSPGAVRARPARRRRLVDDGRLQPPARDALLRAPRAPHDDPAGRVGMGRRRDLRLVRDAEHGAGGARRSRPRDAGAAYPLGTEAGGRRRCGRGVRSTSIEAKRARLALLGARTGADTRPPGPIVPAAPPEAVAVAREAAAAAAVLLRNERVACRSGQGSAAWPWSGRRPTAR